MRCRIVRRKTTSFALNEYRVRAVSDLWIDFILEKTTFSNHCQLQIWWSLLIMLSVILWWFYNFRMNFYLYVYCWYSSTAKVVHFTNISCLQCNRFVPCQTCVQSWVIKKSSKQTNVVVGVVISLLNFLHLYTIFRSNYEKAGISWHMISTKTQKINDQTIHWLHNSSWTEPTKRCVYQQLQCCWTIHEREKQSSLCSDYIQCSHQNSIVLCSLWY